MRRLPAHHIPRPRLVDLCARHEIVVVEASAGYGKTVLGAELVDRWGAISIEVPLDRRGVTAPLLAARLRAAVVRAGFTEAGAAAGEAGQDAVGAVDAVLAALAGEPCAIVVDDAHDACPDAAALIDRIASRLGGGQRLVVLARHLPDGLERLRRAECLLLTSADLALDDAETLEVCRSGFGIDLDAAAARTLREATGGWTAATVLAAARLARTGEDLGAVVSTAARTSHSAGAVAAILDEALVALGSDWRPALAQVARLPLLDAELVDLVAGREGFFERGLELGLPFSPGRPPWWDMPGPVRDHLATFAAADASAMRRAAHHYARHDEPGQALQLLLSTGDAADAARLLAETPPEVLEGMDALELLAAFEQMPDAALEAHPEALLVVARSFRTATRYDQCDVLLARARVLAERTSDAVMERAVAAEEVHMLLHRLRDAEAEPTARRILRDAAPGERLTRGRAYQALAQVLCKRVDEAGRRDGAALDEAERCFTQANLLYRALGMRSAVSALTPYWAISLDLGRGRAADAMHRLDDALALTADRPRRRAYLLCFKTWVAAEMGQDDLCRTCAEELFRIAAELDSDLFFAHGHWKLAMLTSYRGDAEATLEHVRQVELHKGAWWGPGSADFLAEAADLLDRVGLTALALQYLERAKAEPKDAAHLVALAEAAIEARHGDPVLAGRLLTGVLGTRIDPREYWRVKLLTAYAAFRRGEDHVGGALAAEAFEEAARLGQPELPLIRERSITEELLGLAVLTGQPAALALDATVLPTSLSLLGRFQFTRGGRPVHLGPGQEAQLLKLVAVNGGRIHAEVAMEAIWPEVTADAGRNRLRTVLNRLRSAAGDVVGREGDMLVLAPSMRVDLADLLVEADRALALAATDPGVGAAIARGAAARYRGELLPDDLYADWAEGPRRRAREVVLELLDLCASDAARRGDLDGLRRVVQQAVEIDPYDGTVYVRAATTLLSQGRRPEALSIARRARAALAEIGLPPPSSLTALEESMSGDRQAASA